jgi:tRNA-2-methylthio-N6-dimethylallyladenosine synthase
VSVVVTEAKPYFLLADATPGSTYELRRSAAGDAWDRAQTESCAVPAAPVNKDGRVLLTLGKPKIK